MKAVVGLTLLTVALVVMVSSGPADASFSAKDVLKMMSLASPMGIWSALKGNAEDAASQPTYVLVQTDLGVLRGTLQNNYVRFAGIPYAKPPTGSLRWQRPVAAPGWGNTVRNATLFGPACPQFGYNDTAGMDEDCLYLNIWAPATLFTNPGPSGIIDLRNSSTTFPVFFWIHGGAFLDGKGSDPTFSGDYWANTTNTVVVTINYRLGPFGFLNAAGSQFEGNYGIRDQQLALQWAQENIRAFSGDPKRVTIAGESAGGMSITLHVVLPGSFNAYRAAITQSNPVSLLYRTPEEDLPYAQKFASQLNCTSISNVTCLYSLPWQTIWESEDLKDWIINFPINTKEVLPWAPTVDGSYLKDQPLYLIQRGEFNREAVQVFGTVKNETQTFIPDVVFPPFLYNSFLGSIFGPQNATLVEQHYPATGLNCRTSLVNALSDYIFVCPTRAASLAISQFNVPSYNYHFLFNGTNPAYEPAICKNSVCHAAELPYEFYSAEFIGRVWTPQTKDMSIRMIEYWAQIVHSKLPGTRVLSKNADPVWPLYNKASNQSLVLNVPVSTIKNYNFDNCNFWDSLGYTF